MRLPLWPSANHYHEQPGDDGDDGQMGDEKLGPGRKILAQAEKAEADGDMEKAQVLRRLLGD